MQQRYLTTVFILIILVALFSKMQFEWKATYLFVTKIADSTKHFLHNSNTLNKEQLTSVTPQCTEAFKRRHFIYLDFQPGRTGNAFFQVCCLLAVSARNCYTPMIHRQNRIFSRSFEPYYDLKNTAILNQTIYYSTFRVIPKSFVYYRRKFDIESQSNWTIKYRCPGNFFIEDQEEFVRSSIRLKKRYLLEAGEYIKKSFYRRSTVAIHVRRTDRINFDNYEFSDFKWYKSYIEKAMKHLKADYNDLSFIFLSDDIAWCKENFHGPHIHFSPGTSVGFDLALLALCDHVILTVGTFGRNGAWIGEHKSVIYSKYFGVPRFYNKDFFMKSWTGI